MPRTRTPAMQRRAREAFPQALVQGHSVSAAATAGSFARSTFYEWRGADAAFATAWDDAVERGTDRLEEEAVRRGRDGVEEPIIGRVGLTGTLRHDHAADAEFLQVVRALGGAAAATAE